MYYLVFRNDCLIQRSLLIPINKLLDSGITPKDIPLPHEFILNKTFMVQLFPSFENGLSSFFSLHWSDYSDFLTFYGGINRKLLKYFHK